jgi:hypothetical protein
MAYKTEEVKVQDLQGLMAVEIPRDNYSPATPALVTRNTKVPWTYQSPSYIVEFIPWVKDKLQGGARVVSRQSNFVIHHYTGQFGKQIEAAGRKLLESNLNTFLRPVTWCTIGGDPEVFAVDENGVVIPAYKFLPDKKKRYGNSPFWDGFQAEFTMQPQTCLAYLTDRVYRGLYETHEAVTQFNPKARLTAASVLDIPEDELASAADEHVMLGCAPSTNVYGIPPIAIEDARRLPFRFAGCHFHLGYQFLNDEAVQNAVKAMDAILGVASVALFEGLEDPRRRQFYGRPGEYRRPALGMDGYRWIWDATEQEVIDIMMTYDVERARTVIQRNASTLRQMLVRVYSNMSKVTPYADIVADCAIKIILEGARKYIDEPDDLAKNWRFGDWLEHCERPNCQFQSFARNVIAREE